MKKKLHLFSLLGWLLLISIVLTACQPVEMPSDQELVETFAAQTLAAHQTQDAVEEIPTDTPTPTQTPEPVETEEPTPTPTAEPVEEEICNQAAFIADLTIEDRTVLRENEAFTKVWRLENIGACAWTTDYQVVFSSGSQMSASAASRLPHTVQPGETVDISLDMVAPNAPGTYTGYWLLIDNEGQVFGLGDDADSPFWVRIRVLEEDEIVVYNFAENYCEAGWESSIDDDIDCPSEEDLDEGFVQFIDQPQLEDGIIYDEPTILTYPDHGRSGYMVGRFPTIQIEDGYHFRATIGCQFGADDCDVRYTLRVYEPSFGHTTLGQWREIYDGLYYPIDVDLSDFAGMEVSIVLSVIAQNDARENYALWLDPRIVRDGQVPQPGPSPIDMEDEEYVELYNLADNYCFAGWESSVVDPIACPSSENLDDGFVQFVDNPRLEDGQYYQLPAILTYPDHDRSGYMVGRFPSLTIQEGDLFRATLGCRFGAGSCDVRYTLRVVLPPGGGFENLGQWRNTYTGSVQYAEVDLSDYAGEQVDLVLSVIAQDDSRENHAIWVNPRVIREIAD
jgi:hypothetical protein